MSQGINRVTLFGNLGADPELRIVSEGQYVLRMRVATTEAYYDKTKQLVERTEWHTVTLFGARAEPLSRILSKGDSVLIEGGMRYSKYEKDGTTRYSAEVIARDVVIGRSRRSPAAVSAVAVEMEEQPFDETQPASPASINGRSREIHAS